MCIIYKCVNCHNNKAYIGKSRKPLTTRLIAHICAVNAGSQTYFHRAIRKYGMDSFTTEILEKAVNYSDDILNKKERYWINYFDTFKNGYNMTIGGGGKSGYHISKESKEKHKKALNRILPNGMTVAKNAAIKRAKTLLNRNPNAFKIIGEKSKRTQQKSNISRGRNSIHFNNNKIFLFNAKGIIVDTFLYSQIDGLSEKYPKRMIEWCLRNKKPMYTGQVRKSADLIFRGWYACYENALFCDITTKFKNIQMQKREISYEIYDPQGNILRIIKSREFKKVCAEMGLSKNQFTYSYSNKGKKIKYGIHKGFSAQKREEIIDVFKNK